MKIYEHGKGFVDEFNYVERHLNFCRDGFGDGDGFGNGYGDGYGDGHGVLGGKYSYYFDYDCENKEYPIYQMSK